MVGAMIGALITQASIDATNTAIGIAQSLRNEKLNQARFDKQIELANTAHQREVQDLRAAGLNPILSTGTAGAAVPQQAASTWDMSPVGNLSNLLNSAVALEKGTAEIDRTNAEKDLLEAQKDKMIAEAAMRKFEADAITDASSPQRSRLQQAIRDELLLKGKSGNPVQGVQKFSDDVGESFNDFYDSIMEGLKRNSGQMTPEGEYKFKDYKDNHPKINAKEFERLRRLRNGHLQNKNKK